MFDSGDKMTLKMNKNKPVQPPVEFCEELRYSEVDVSLYSQFSDDGESTKDLKSVDHVSSEKHIISKLFMLYLQTKN